MNKKHLAIALAIAVATTLVILLWPGKSTEYAKADFNEKEAKELDLRHRQDVYLHALEWCESRGYNDAKNPNDLDGTPSYSNFQWKPETMIGFAIQYKIIHPSSTIEQFPELVKDYELQDSILREMLKDKEVDWKWQFPGCTKKIGMPPFK